MKLPLRIRELRKKKHLTINQVAAEVGTSVSHISEVERGRKNVSNDLLLRIAIALDTEPYALIAPEYLSPLADVMSGLTPEDRDRVLRFAEALDVSMRKV
ncbi:helix-turn-helix transcriptional regulator [Sulfitobacter sp. R18_1]|nr:helix-turn-helix transcriptional regulator [Sulfitobacter sp. R18_1]